MSTLKPEDIVFSLKKPYLLVHSNAPIYLERPFGCEQADSRERPAPSHPQACPQRAFLRLSQKALNAESTHKNRR